MLDRPEVPVLCALKGCTRRLSVSKVRRNAKYCCRDHASKAAQRAYQERQKAKKAAAKMVSAASDVSRERKGDVYRWLMDPSNRVITDGLLAGSIEPSYAAHLIGCTTSAVSRALQAVRTTEAFEVEKAKWRRPWRVEAMLPVQKLSTLRTVPPDSETFDATVDELVRAYAVFSKYYFTLEGRRPIVKPFHMEWAKAIIKAYVTGSKQLILSPPRFGKSEMLVRFCVWFIAMDPDIRIGWFCASTDVAKLMLGAVRDHFENNERLIVDTLPPGDVYKPDRSSGKPWSNKEIKVRQQSHVGQKSSSLLALGRTSKFLSRDMDIIIIDDLEDFDSTREPAQREYSRNKLAEIGTRKEEHTAEIYIGSRQHPDDIPNHILSLAGSTLQWDMLVYSAHDENCGNDPDEWDQHVDCMLFPEVRTYRWLMEKKVEMDTLGIPHAFSMRYLNRPIPPEGQVFKIERIREHVDRGRGIGLDGLPLGRLAAGLDPSARGIQAAFLWHYTPSTGTEPVRLSMVDLDTEQSGGMAGAHRIMRHWHSLYGVNMWFYEDNSQQVEFFNDPRTRELANELGITIKPFRTGRNKMDPELGISSMAPWYHDGRISLPYGTGEARKKVNMLLRQLELWTSEGVPNRRHVTDIKMASWFPFPYFVALEKKHRAPTSITQKEGSYRGIERISEAPWGQTQYPTG